jgi:hypothetical protein
MSSSYLDNIMRSGAQAFNAKVTFTGTTVTIASYDGQPYAAINPLLCRFDSATICEYAGPDLSLDFGAQSFGKGMNDGIWTGHIGLLRISDTVIVPTFSLSAEFGLLETKTSPAEYETYSVGGETGNVILVARLHNMRRLNGIWDTTNSWIEE